MPIKNLKDIILKKILLPLALITSFFGIIFTWVILDDIGDFDNYVLREVEVIESSIDIQPHSAAIKGGYKLNIKIRDIQANKTSTNVRVRLVAKETSKKHFNGAEKQKERYKDIQKQYYVGKVFSAFATPDLNQYYFEKPNVTAVKLFLYFFISLFLFLLVLRLFLFRNPKKSKRTDP